MKMKFIDTVTTFHKETDGVYNRKVINGCYWYGDSSITIQGSGVVRDDSIHVFFPRKIVEQYMLKVYKGDRIIKGEVQDITSVNELAKYDDKITVTSVNENHVGSRLDNLLVTGK